jgi:hypothetical protein
MICKILQHTADQYGVGASCSTADCSCAHGAPTAAADLLAVLGVAKQHEGDHLDFAVLGLLHAARHRLQHRPRAKALCQLVLLLPDLQMDAVFASAPSHALVCAEFPALACFRIGKALKTFPPSMPTEVMGGGAHAMHLVTTAQVHGLSCSRRPATCYWWPGVQCVPHLDAALGLALNEFDLLAPRPNHQLHLQEPNREASCARGCCSVVHIL